MTRLIYIITITQIVEIFSTFGEIYPTKRRKFQKKSNLWHLGKVWSRVTFTMIPNYKLLHELELTVVSDTTLFRGIIGDNLGTYLSGISKIPINFWFISFLMQGTNRYAWWICIILSSVVFLLSGNPCIADCIACPVPTIVELKELGFLSFSTNFLGHCSDISNVFLDIC